MTRAQLQTIADLVAIAHDEYDGCPSYRDDLERFDRVLAEIKAEPQPAIGDVAAMRAALERAIDAIQAMLALYDEEHVAAVKNGATWGRSDTSEVDAIVEKARAALAAPARNCDRPFRSVNEALGAYAAERGDGPHLGYCDAIKWALAPAAQ